MAMQTRPTSEQRARAVLTLRKRRREGSDEYSTFKTKYRNNRTGFVQDCIKWRAGEGPTQYQLEILRAFDTGETHVSARGPHGLGKTALAAWLILHFALTRDDPTGTGGDWKVITTASAWRQLTKYLWPEVHKWTRRLDWAAIGRLPFDERNELLIQSLKLNTGEAFPVACTDSATIEGAHGNSLFYVYDEAKAIPNETFDATEGAFAGAGEDGADEAFALAISTPGSVHGRFYEIHTHSAGLEHWWTKHVTLEEAIEAGRVTRSWAERLKRLWGETSALFKNRVLGEFADADSDGVIPLRWIELAVERWKDLKDAGVIDDLQEAGEADRTGVDVASGGEAKTIFALRKEWVIFDLREYNQADTMQTAGRLVMLLNKFGGTAVIDVIGIGNGVYYRLLERGRETGAKWSVAPFVAGAKTDWTDDSGELQFADVRSAAHWNFRQLLDPDYGRPVAIPDDPVLIGDLAAPHYKELSRGVIKVESKRELQKPDRLGRSTDKGDAVLQAFWEDLQVESPGVFF